MSAQAAVLIVDDEDICLKITSRMLEQVGVPVLCARDGVEAVQLYDRHHRHIGLVLMDINMPRMNGIEAFQRLKNRYADVRVVFVSGYQNKATREQIDTLGATGFIEKPMKFETLANYLDIAPVE